MLGSGTGEPYNGRRRRSGAVGKLERAGLQLREVLLLPGDVGEPVARVALCEGALEIGVARGLVRAGAQQVAHGEVTALVAAARRAHVQVELARALGGLAEEVE